MKDSTLSTLLISVAGLHAAAAGPVIGALLQSPAIVRPAASHTGGQYANGLHTGPAVYTIWGYVQVEASVQNGRLVDVQCPRYPNERPRSAQISANAMPILRSEAIKAQSADVDVVTGATDTSIAYAKSLQAALAKAG